jgi:hypothetical protein
VCNVASFGQRICHDKVGRTKSVLLKYIYFDCVDSRAVERRRRREARGAGSRN